MEQNNQKNKPSFVDKAKSRVSETVSSINGKVAGIMTGVPVASYLAYKAIKYIGGKPVLTIGTGVEVVVISALGVIGAYHLSKLLSRADKAEKSFDVLLDEVSEPIVVHRQDGTVLAVNKAAEAKFALSREQIVGRVMDVSMIQSQAKTEQIGYRGEDADMSVFNKNSLMRKDDLKDAKAEDSGDSVPLGKKVYDTLFPGTPNPDSAFRG